MVNYLDDKDALYNDIIFLLMKEECQRRLSSFIKNGYFLSESFKKNREAKSTPNDVVDFDVMADRKRRIEFTMRTAKKIEEITMNDNV